MPKRQIFYSFHFDNDVFRVQQIRNIGALEDNTPVSPNDWETVKRGGSKAIEKWIDENMNYRSCVVVLIGEKTSTRDWVKYEIEKAWKDGKGLFGLYVHNLKDPRTGTCKKGQSPFDHWTFKQNGIVKEIACYDPPAINAYKNIATNMEAWVEAAILQRKN